MSQEGPSLDILQMEDILVSQGAAALLQELQKALDAEGTSLIQGGVCELVIQAIHLERDFLSRHPQELFSVLWNTLWWASSEALLSWYPSHTLADFALLSNEALAKAIQVQLGLWGDVKQAEAPGFAWVRSLRPPAQLLGQGLVAKALWHGRGQHLLFSEDGRELRSWGFEVTPVSLGSEEVMQEAETTVSYAQMTWDWQQDLPVWKHWLEPFDAEPSEPPYSFINLNVSPDGKWRVGSVYTQDLDESGHLRILDAKTERPISVLPTPTEEHEHYMFSMMRGIFSPDGRWVAGAGWEWDGEGMVCLWKLDLQPKRRFWWRAAPKHECVLKHAPGPFVDVLAFSPDSRYLAVGFSRHIDIFETETQALKRRLEGMAESPYTIAFSPDNKLLAVVVGGCLQLFSLTQAKANPTPAYLQESIGWTGFSEYGFRLYQQPFLFDGWDGSLIKRLDDAPGGYLVGGPPTPSHWLCERRLYSLYIRGHLRSWVPQNAQEIKLPGGGLGDVMGGSSMCVAFALDGRLGVCGFQDRTRLYIVRPEEDTVPLLCEGPPLFCLALSHNGAYVALGSAEDGTVVVLDTTDGTEQWRADDHAGRITQLRFSKDDASLLIAPINDDLVLRRTQDGALLGKKPMGVYGVTNEGHSHDPDVPSLYHSWVEWEPRAEALEVLDGWCGFDAGMPEGPYRFSVGEHCTQIHSHEGGTQELVATYTAREPMQAHPSGRIWANEHEHITLALGYPPSFPQVSGGDPLVPLRHWLTQEPSKKSWLHICYLLEDAKETTREMLVDYVTEHTATWDKSLKRPLYSWWERAQRGESTGFEGLGLDWSVHI